MRHARAITIIVAAFLAGSTAANAQTAPAEDSRDKIVPKDIGGGAADWEEEPWWMALADCSAAFRLAPEDRAKVQTFGVAATKRIVADRAIAARDAAPMILAYMRGQGQERAEVTSGIFGMEALRSRCDKVMVQYNAQ